MVFLIAGGTNALPSLHEETSLYIFVAVFAVGFFRIQSGTTLAVPCQHVCAVSYRFQMARIHATPDITSVVDFQIARYCTVDDFVDKSVSETRLALFANYAVPIPVKPARPQPAASIRLWNKVSIEKLNRR